jgi:hypothetical protein
METHRGMTEDDPAIRMQRDIDILRMKVDWMESVLMERLRLLLEERTKHKEHWWNKIAH